MVNPSHRLPQHNGSICKGALQTQMHRPWEMILVVHGLSMAPQTQQFKWAWHNPHKSIDVRQAASNAKLKSFRGVQAKVWLLFMMVALPKWKNLSLSIWFAADCHVKFQTKRPPLPSHVTLSAGSIEDLGQKTKDKGEEEQAQGAMNKVLCVKWASNICKPNRDWLNQLIEQSAMCSFIIINSTTISSSIWKGYNVQCG